MEAVHYEFTIHAFILTRVRAVQYLCLQILDMLHDGRDKKVVTYDDVIIIAHTLCFWLKQFIGDVYVKDLYNGILGVMEVVVVSAYEGRNVIRRPFSYERGRVSDDLLKKYWSDLHARFPEIPQYLPTNMVEYNIIYAVYAGPAYSYDTISQYYTKIKSDATHMANVFFRWGNVYGMWDRERFPTPVINDNCEGKIPEEVTTLSSIYDSGTRTSQCKTNLVPKDGAGIEDEIRYYVGVTKDVIYRNERYRLLSQCDGDATDRRLRYTYEPDVTSLGLYYVDGRRIIPLTFRGYKFDIPVRRDSSSGPERHRGRDSSRGSRKPYIRTEEIYNPLKFRVVMPFTPHEHILFTQGAHGSYIYAMMGAWLYFIKSKCSNLQSYSSLESVLTKYTEETLYIYFELMAKHWGDLGILLDALYHNYTLRTEDGVMKCIANLLGVTVMSCDGRDVFLAQGATDIGDLVNTVPMAIMDF